MRLFVGASAFFCCAIASFGCSSPPSGPDKGIFSSYAVMVTAGSSVDSDVMTVTEGSNSSLLLTFEFGITTTVGSPNAGGIRATLSGDKVTVAAQPAHVDHWMGPVDGNISGSGTISKTGNCDLTLQFAPASGTGLTLGISGSKL